MVFSAYAHFLNNSLKRHRICLNSGISAFGTHQPAAPARRCHEQVICVCSVRPNDRHLPVKIHKILIFRPSLTKLYTLIFEPENMEDMTVIKFICPVCSSNRFFFTSFSPEQNLPHGAVCSVCGTRLTTRSCFQKLRRRRWPKQVV